MREDKLQSFVYMHLAFQLNIAGQASSQRQTGTKDSVSDNFLFCFYKSIADTLLRCTEGPSISQ